MKTWKLVPRPGSDSTSIWPSWRSTSDLTIDSPRPVPGRRAGGAAGPVEAVEHVVALLGGHADARVGDHDLHPRAVGLDADVDAAALRRCTCGRWSAGWRRSDGSGRGRRARAAAPARRRRRASGAWRRSAAPSARRRRAPPRRRRSAAAMISTLSASIRATSSRSLTSSTSLSVERRTMSMNSRWRSDMFSGLRSSSSTNPLIEVSGLRSSCEAVATNSLLARSRRARSVMSRTVQTTPSSGAEPRGGDGQRCVHRARSPSRSSSATSQRRQRAAFAVDLLAAAEARGRARRRGGWWSRSCSSRLGDDQRVAQALDRHRQALGAPPRSSPARWRGPRPSR